MTISHTTWLRHTKDNQHSWCKYFEAVSFSRHGGIASCTESETSRHHRVWWNFQFLKDHCQRLTKTRWGRFSGKVIYLISRRPQFLLRASFDHESDSLGTTARLGILLTSQKLSWASIQSLIDAPTLCSLLPLVSVDITIDSAWKLNPGSKRCQWTPAIVIQALDFKKAFNSANIFFLFEHCVLFYEYNQYETHLPEENVEAIDFERII